MPLSHIDSPRERPKISVVTPSFNQAQFLEATLNSVHSPGYPNVEHIVVDGGSVDGSLEIIERYQGRLAYWCSEPDEGQTDALIKGFSRATGDILCWLNSDDLFEPNALFEVADYFSTHPEVEFVYGDSTWIDTKGRVLKPKREHRWNRFVWMFDHNFIPQPSAFWRASLYKRVGGLDATFDLAMDADLWIRFAEVTQPRHVRRLWSRMRFYAEQKNTRLRAQSGVEGRAIRARYASPLPLQQTRVRRISARTLRLILKISAGGYSGSEIASHVKTLFGQGSWQQRKATEQEATEQKR